MRSTRQFVFCLLAAAAVVPAGCGPARGPAVPVESRPEDAGHQRMSERLAARRQASLRQDPLFGDWDLREATALLERGGLTDWERFGALYLAGIAAKRLGRMQEAVGHLQEAYRLVQNIPAAVKARLPGVEQRTLFELAGACLRLGETENCIACQTSDSCIFPIRPGGVHSQPRGSRMAVQCLERLLDDEPDHLGARWLLNVAAMTLGEYPQAVPARYRLPESRTSTASDFPRFVNVAARAGLNTVSLSGGVIVDDFDRDGWLDVVVSDWSDAGQLRFFRNQRNGRFEMRVEEAGFDGMLGGLNLLQADYDNDGDLDILVLRGAWRPADGTSFNSLLENDGRGFFRDVTFAAGLAEPALPSGTAGWADYDNDGDLDLYVGNEQFPCQLFENDGQGRFRDVAARAGVENRLFTKAVVWGDYNGDGLPDLYVSNYGEPIGDDGFGSGAGQFTSQSGQPNRLYRNNGDKTFTDVAEAAGVERPLLSFPAWFWDFNNDGALDLFVATYDGSVASIAADMFGEPGDHEPVCLYQGDGSGRFKVVADKDLRNRLSMTMGANFGDLNNDGFDDLLLGTGHPAYEGLMPNRLLLNQRGERFLDVTTPGGFGHLQKGHGIAFADVDNDGDQDVFAELGGAFPGDTAANALFENPGFENHFLVVRLVGRQSNRSAIGARLHLRIREGERARSIFRWVGSGGSFGAKPLRQEIGLGAASVVERLEIDWPASGVRQQFENVAADRFLEIHEGREEIRAMEWK